jgi:3'(2'), 5'-bisphosphate nucleotidase
MPMLSLEIPEIRFALNAVSQAARLVKQVQSELVSSALTKDDRSPVTVADFASQALVGSLLDEMFPQDALVGEEDSGALRRPEGRLALELVTEVVLGFVTGGSADSVCAWIDRGAGEPAGRFWTLDPIDGTKGFLRGDQYAIALALIVNGKVQIGALGCPQLSDPPGSMGESAGLLAIAARGEGAWIGSMDGSPGSFSRVQVSAVSSPDQAKILRSLESGHTNIGKVDNFAQALGVRADPVRMDSQAKYVMLAAGHGDLYLRLLSPAQPDYREKIWDQAAGSLLVSEAGGLVTDLSGKELDFSAGRTLENNRGILASNRRLHPAALAALQAIAA